MQNNILEMVALALTVTFMHSLWQACILAALAWVTLGITANLASATRYRILTGYFTAFIVTAIYTFISVLGESNNSGSGTVLTGPAVWNNILPGTDPQISFLTSVSGWCRENAIIVARGWAAVFLLKCFLFARSLAELNSIKKFHAPVVGTGWIKKLAELSSRIQLDRVVEFRESEKVNQPFVFGLLRPVLFVPVGMLVQLLPAEVEAVLLHELAHIKRQDLLVNFLQVLTGTIFFFNPFVYWLSGMIRLEREYCCDDICVKTNGDKKALISALISFHERPGALLSTALPLAGTKNIFTNRVYRIINGKSRNTSWYGACLLPLCFFGLALVLLSLNKLQADPKAYLPAIYSNNKPAERSSPGEKSFTDPPQDTTRPKRKNNRSVPPLDVKQKFPIPENASAAFIAGYQAGKKYANESLPAGDKAIKEMAEIEKNSGLQNNINLPPKNTSPVLTEYNSKREIEMKLLKKAAG